MYNIMKMFVNLLTLISVALFFPISSYSQGCSDAGACTLQLMGSNNSNQEEDMKYNSVTAGFSIGSGDNKTKIFTPFIEYTRILDSSMSLSGKFTYAYIDGDLGTNNGSGDFIISGNYTFSENISTVLGFKIPLNDASATSAGQALPMVYQTSLGTYDLIASINYRLNSFSAGLAYQQPVIQNNNNQFLPLIHIVQSDDEYLASKMLERNGDLILRFSYDLKLFDELIQVSPVFLPIYHIGNDTYKDNDQTFEIKGSQGITLNAILNTYLNITGHSKIQLTLGMPLKNRDAIPDGLKRSFVGIISYSINL